MIKKKRGNINSEKFSNNRYCYNSHPSVKTEMKTKPRPRPTDKVHSHIPTLRCHEDVVSNTFSPFAVQGCVSDCEKNCCNSDGQSVGQKNLGLKKKRSVKVTDRFINNRPTSTTNLATDTVGYTIYASNSVPSPIGATESTHSCKHVLRSKSVPIPTDYLENSVDIIPVKLASSDKFGAKPQIDLNGKNGKSKLGQDKSRATWDKLLKGEVQNELRDSKPKPLPNINNKHVKEGSLEMPLHHPKNGEISGLSNLKQIKVDANDSTSKHEKPCVCLDAEFSRKILECNRPSDATISPDPVNTLDFLIKQLRDKLMKQPENDNLQKIIHDMESALLKISDENQAYTKKTIGLDKNVFGITDSSTCSTVGTKSGADSNENVLKDNSNNQQINVAKFQSKLEESCFYLQSLCVKQRENISNNLQEKDQLTIQLAESRRLLACAKEKEKDYEVKIGELRLKVQESSSKIERQNENVKLLYDTISKLKAENEILRSYKDSVRRLNSRLKEVARENEMLSSKLSLKDLEIEKLKILLEVKESSSPRSLCSNDKKSKKLIEHELNSKMLLEEEDKNVSLVSLSTVTSWADKAAIACSSQASSSPRHSPSPYSSWQDISVINQQPLAASKFNTGIGDIFKNLKKKTELTKPPSLNLELPSSNNSFWSNRNEEFNSKSEFSDIDSGALSS